MSSSNRPITNTLVFSIRERINSKKSSILFRRLKRPWTRQQLRRLIFFTSRKLLSATNSTSKWSNASKRSRKKRVSAEPQLNSFSPTITRMPLSPSRLFSKIRGRKKWENDLPRSSYRRSSVKLLSRITPIRTKLKCRVPCAWQQPW